MEEAYQVASRTVNLADQEILPTFRRFALNPVSEKGEFIAKIRELVEVSGSALGRAQRAHMTALNRLEELNSSWQRCFK